MNERKSLFAFPRRRWFVRRLTQGESWWIYLFGGRIAFYKFGFGGFRWFSIYVTTNRLTLNWRVIGS